MLRVGVKGGDYSGWRWSCQFAFTYTVEGGVAAGGKESDVYRERQQDEAADAGADEPGKGFGEAGEGVHGERFVFIPNTVAVLGIGDGALFAFVEVKLYGAFLFFEGFAQYVGNAFVIVHDFNGRL